MIIHKTFRYRLEPTLEQTQLLSSAAGCVRFVWNRALSIQKSYLEQKCGILSFVEMSKCLTNWRNGEAFSFLSESTRDSQQQTLRFLDRALMDAFDKKSPKKFPTFKKKGKKDRVYHPHPERIKLDLQTEDKDGRRIQPKIYLPKIGWLKFRNSRPIEGKIRNATVSREVDNWYVSIQTEIEVADPKHPSNSAIGADRGVANLLTLSDGTFFAPITAFRDQQLKLVKEQKKLARKKRHSVRWNRQKTKIAKLHQHVSAIRKNALHQISTIISKNHAVVVLEDLKVRNMTGSAKGTTEQPGKRIKQKAGLNKSILDQGWSILQGMLDYKLRWLGGMLILVNPAFTSQTCSVCGHVDSGNRLEQAVFHCLHCGHDAHADLNAAQNILAKGTTAGHAGLACFTGANL